MKKPRVILITGASTGIGRATAVHFARQGWAVAATMRRPENPDPALRHPQIKCYALEVTEAASVGTAVQQVMADHGRIDALLNNAGYGLFGPLEALDMAGIERQLQTNVYGPIRTMQAVIPIMRAQHSGIILNVSSIGGRMAFPFTGAYHATKFALEGLSEAMRFELKAHNIGIKLIEPGGIKTDFNRRSLDFRKHPAYEPQLGNYEQLLQDDRYWASPEAVAKVIYRAATDGSDKLRYPAKPGPFFLLHALLPDVIWRAFGHFMLNRNVKVQPSPA